MGVADGDEAGGKREGEGVHPQTQIERSGRGVQPLAEVPTVVRRSDAFLWPPWLRIQRLLRDIAGGSAWEPTPWRAVQQAAWQALV